jgi:hypothetical protein
MPVAIATAGKRIEVKLTLSIPFEDFDETDGLDRLTNFLMSVVQAKNAIAVAAIAPGSVEVSLLVDEADSPRLVQAFADNRLEPIQATALTVPRQVTLLYAAALVSAGAVMPILIPVLPFAALLIGVQRLRQAGIEVSFTEDSVRLQRTSAAGPSSADTVPDLAAADPSLIRRVIAVVTPDAVLPSFPCSLTLRLEPNDHDGERPAALGERLESLLLQRDRLRPRVSRVAPGPDWPGTLALELTSADDLREMAAVILTYFLGRNVTLAFTQKRSGTFLGGRFNMDGEVRVNLSASVWESVTRELAEGMARLRPASPN